MREDLEAPFAEIEHANRDGRGVERLFERTRDALGRRFVCRDARLMENRFRLPRARGQRLASSQVLHGAEA